MCFRRQTANFGAAVVGSVSQLRVDLCNPSSFPVAVLLADPELPFLVAHNEVLLLPRSFVRLLVRFVPVAERESSALLVAQTGGGQTSLLLLGVGVGVGGASSNSSCV